MMLETEAGTGIYEETTASEWPTDGYVFNTELSKCENGGIVFWDDESKSVKMKSNISDKCYVYFDIANQTFADYIINELYTEDGANGLYYHDGQGTYTNASEEAGDKSYRYSGANPNNYVCFGSDAATCPNDNLYRIIGLFDDDKDGVYNIKLIKSTSYGRYVWNSGNNNNWNATNKPDIYTTLNTLYWKTLSSEWQSKVEQTYQWQVGGMIQERSYTAKQYYDIELKNQTGYEETMPIGLMYVSDYGYAASPENWKTALNDYMFSTYKPDWLYLYAEWTISLSLSNSKFSFAVGYDGAYAGCESIGTSYNIRPCLFLKPNITIKNGIGTSSNPYRITE